MLFMMLEKINFVGYFCIWNVQIMYRQTVDAEPVVVHDSREAMKKHKKPKF